MGEIEKADLREAWARPTAETHPRTLEQSLSFQILVCLLIYNIPTGVFIFFLSVRLPSFRCLLQFQLGPQGDRVFNLCHISKVGSIWDAQTPHAVSMAPLSKVPLEGLRTSVGIVSTNLTVIVDI